MYLALVKKSLIFVKKTLTMARLFLVGNGFVKKPLTLAFVKKPLTLAFVKNWFTFLIESFVWGI
jgi:hypothetical protein